MSWCDQTQGERQGERRAPVVLLVLSLASVGHRLLGQMVRRDIAIRGRQARVKTRHRRTEEELGVCSFPRASEFDARFARGQRARLGASVPSTRGEVVRSGKPASPPQAPLERGGERASNDPGRYGVHADGTGVARPMTGKHSGPGKTRWRLGPSQACSLSTSTPLPNCPFRPRVGSHHAGSGAPSQPLTFPVEARARLCGSHASPCGISHLQMDGGVSGCHD